MSNQSYERLLSVLDKAEQGPLTEEKDWDRQIISATMKTLVSDYEIEWDQVSLLNTDDAFADRIFEAGMNFAVKTGVYCTNTNRRMLWTQAELEDVLAQLPTAVTAGQGADAVTIHARRPDDDTRVVIVGGAWGTPYPEDLYALQLEAYAREPLFDMLDNASLLTTHSRPTKGSSPWEAVASWQEVQIALDVAERVGRPGVSLGSGNNSPTEVGDTTSTTHGGYRPTDKHVISFMSEQKTSYDQLIKAVHFAQTGSFTEVYCNPMYGGYLGGGPGVAVASVAGLLLLSACYGGELVDLGCTHTMLSCSTHPDIIKAKALAFQAISRNTNLIPSPFIRPVAGPGTKDILYECAALTIASVVSGVSYIDAVQSATGNHTAHTSPLEARFCAQVAHAVTGMTRQEVAPLVQGLIDKYQAGLQDKHIGKPFNEVYDLESLTPTAEWQGLYEEVCAELNSDFGLAIQV